MLSLQVVHDATTRLAQLKKEGCHRYMLSLQVVHDATTRLAQLQKEGCHRYLIPTSQITPDVTPSNKTLECSREMATQKHHAQAGLVLKDKSILTALAATSVVSTTAPETVYTVAEGPASDADISATRPTGATSNNNNKARLTNKDPTEAGNIKNNNKSVLYMNARSLKTVTSLLYLSFVKVT